MTPLYILQIKMFLYGQKKKGYKIKERKMKRNMIVYLNVFKWRWLWIIDVLGLTYEGYMSSETVCEVNVLHQIGSNICVILKGNIKGKMSPSSLSDSLNGFHYVDHSPPRLLTCVTLNLGSESRRCGRRNAKNPTFPKVSRLLSQKRKVQHPLTSGLPWQG